MKKLRAGVVGLRMGRNHVSVLAGHPDVDLVAICDIDEALGNEIADSAAGITRAENGTSSAPSRPRPKVYTDYDAMIAAESLDLVTVATPNRFHAQMTIAAAKAGVKGVCCEKPIAVDLGQAREMVSVCREHTTRLIVSHQRRLGPDFVWMREQMASGAIGDVYLIRGTCAGDMLSDGTHLIDSTLFLGGDVPWKWVFAGSHREDYEGKAGDGKSQTSGGGYDKTGGWRFGHPVEDGMFAVMELESGIRVEFLTGDIRVPGRPYHDIEVIGTKGSLWRAGDKDVENLFRRNATGAWEPVTEITGKPSVNRIALSYDRFVKLIASGGQDAEHPLGTPFAMRGFELLMGIYESARTRGIVQPPVQQERYPLAVELGLTE